MIESIDFVSIATNGYDKYAIQLLRSADQYLVTANIPTFHIFTDARSKFENLEFGLQNIAICIHDIPAAHWPRVTLMRYELITQNANHFHAQVLGWIDADMNFVAEVGPELNPNEWVGGLAFVQHPGYWRPTPYILQMKSRPGTVVRDLLRLIKYGSLGTWETRKLSRAYVNRPLRKIYCCGGIWLGLHKNVVQFSSEMKNAVDWDAANSITARWHDESHLNRYVSGHASTILPPSYCYDSAFSISKNVIAQIVAVRK
jgi:Glycosyltransferase family 6